MVQKAYRRWIFNEMRYGIFVFLSKNSVVRDKNRKYGGREMYAPSEHGWRGSGETVFWRAGVQPLRREHLSSERDTQVGIALTWPNSWPSPRVCTQMTGKPTSNRNLPSNITNVIFRPFRTMIFSIGCKWKLCEMRILRHCSEPDEFPCLPISWKVKPPLLKVDSS